MRDYITISISSIIKARGLRQELEKEYMFDMKAV